VAAQDDPLEIAARALRHRDRTRAQIAERLERAGVEPARQEDALDTLERVGYVDDARFARSRAAALAGRGQGDAAIRHDLEASGADAEAVAEALAALEPEAERAAAIAATAGRTAKTAAQLARRGFSQESIESAVGWEIAGGGAAGV
jgi:regulatory protein